MTIRDTASISALLFVYYLLASTYLFSPLLPLSFASLLPLAAVLFASNLLSCSLLKFLLVSAVNQLLQ